MSNWALIWRQKSVVVAIAALLAGFPLVSCGQGADALDYSPEEIQEIASDSGRWTAYYIDMVTPWCEENYGEENCIVAVYELIEGGQCGWKIDRKLDWPSNLSSSKIYFIHMVDAGGAPTGYQTISAGKRWLTDASIPDSHDCWKASGEYPPSELLVPLPDADAVRLSFSKEVRDKYERLAICSHLSSYLSRIPNGAKPSDLYEVAQAWERDSYQAFIDQGLTVDGKVAPATVSNAGEVLNEKIELSCNVGTDGEIEEHVEAYRAFKRSN